MRDDGGQGKWGADGRERASIEQADVCMVIDDFSFEPAAKKKGMSRELVE